MLFPTHIKSIGSFCSIASGVIIGPNNHNLDSLTSHPFVYNKTYGFISDDLSPIVTVEKNDGVVIMNDVWIGANAIILPNVTIGNGVIIGAGAIVTKDIPDYAIACGNPARVVKFRFTEDQIKILNRIKWWDWPDEKIKENIHFFRTNDLTQFFERAETEVCH